MARALCWAAAATGVMAAVAWWAWPAPPAMPAAVVLTSPPSHGTAKGWSLLALGGADTPAKPGPSAAQAMAAPEDLWHRLFVDGSLRGAELDGAWGDWDGQRLAPSQALRLRFDQLLTTVGETSTEALRTLVAWLAARDLGAAGADAVLAVWDRYLKLQQHQFRETMDLTRPERWPYVLQEHQLARREALGMAWADAFYRDEEAAFRQRIDQGPTQRAEAQPNWTAAAPQGVSAEAWQRQRVTALGQEAADRLLAEERAQAEWNQRLADARLSIERLAGAPELSAVQRQEAAQSWLNEHFQGTDRLRASALLGL